MNKMLIMLSALVLSGCAAIPYKLIKTDDNAGKVLQTTDGVKYQIPQMGGYVSTDAAVTAFQEQFKQQCIGTVKEITNSIMSQPGTTLSGLLTPSNNGLVLSEAPNRVDATTEALDANSRGIVAAIQAVKATEMLGIVVQAVDACTNGAGYYAWMIEKEQGKTDRSLRRSEMFDTALQKVGDIAKFGVLGALGIGGAAVLNGGSISWGEQINATTD